jgi:dTDP-4-amino-4,6-dideoxygalactose transaminase/predicted dehydrogenase
MQERKRTPSAQLRAAVIGAGKFGRYHALKYAAMKDVKLVGIVDQDLKAAKKVAQEHGCRAFYNIDTIVGRVDFVSIATPATTHRKIALYLLEAGVHVYIEKPIACTLEDADAILQAAKKHNRIVAVGHQERYILHRLHLDAHETPRSIECHRLNTWTGRATDVDVALDLMIHDIDLVLQLASGPITINKSSGHQKRPCNNDVEAELTVGSCTAHLTASRRAKKQTRNIRITYPNGAVFIDFVACRIEDTRPITLKARYSDLISGSDGVTYDPLGLALSDFVQAVRMGREPFVSGADGRRALAVTLDMLQAPPLPPSRPVPTSTPNDPIPLFDLETSALHIRADINHRISRVLDHRQYINGPEVHELEAVLATYTGARYCLTCSSGTTALQIALMAEDLTKDDAVFLPAFTYNATCNAVITAGATPIFVDVDKETCNICPLSLEKTIDRVIAEGRLRLRIIIAVDLYGLPADYPALHVIAQKHNLLILSDAAQSLGGSQSGSQVGNIPGIDITATSFYPSKTLGGYGDGGALFTNDAERHERWKRIRWHGTDDNGESVRVGINGRLGSLLCAVLLAKLGGFKEEIRARAKMAELYRRLLNGRVDMQRGDEGHANGLFTIVLQDATQRDYVRRTFQSAGIATGVYYAKPLHRHRAFREYVLHGQKLENAQWLAERVLSLPLSPYMSQDMVGRVCEVLLGALDGTFKGIDVARL